MGTVIPLLLAGGVAALAATGRAHRREQRRRAAEWLDVPLDASPATIRAGWARAMTTAHPDGGGSTEQVRRINRARDVLLGTKERP